MKKQSEYAQRLRIKTLASMWRDNPKKKQLREELPFIAELLDAFVESDREYKRADAEEIRIRREARTSRRGDSDSGRNIPAPRSEDVDRKTA